MDVIVLNEVTRCAISFFFNQYGFLASLGLFFKCKNPVSLHELSEFITPASVDVSCYQTLLNGVKARSA